MWTTIRNTMLAGIVIAWLAGALFVAVKFVEIVLVG